MGRSKAGISLLILALVLLAGPDTEAAAFYSVGEVVMPTSSSCSRGLEDGVAPELGVVTAADLGVHSRVFNGIRTGALEPNKQVCTKKDKCPGRGEPYTRPCARVYHCG